jgi:hypothetical protein
MIRKICIATFFVALAVSAPAASARDQGAARPDANGNLDALIARHATNGIHRLQRAGANSLNVTAPTAGGAADRSTRQPHNAGNDGIGALTSSSF